MHNAFKLAAVAALCASAVAAHAQVAFDANLELDTTYSNEVKAPASNARDSDLTMGGRVEFNVGAKATNGDAFVQARASLLLKKDGDTGTDDMWVAFGNAGGDVKLGRFEAMDLFPLGKDVVVENSGYGGYRANKLRGRFGSDTVHTALGLNAGPARVEVGLVYSKDTDAVRGVRPAVSFTTGPVTLRAGVESVKVVGGGESTNGVGLSMGYALSKDASMNFNLGKMEDDKSFGFNATFGPAGVGLILDKGANSAKNTTFYAAYSLPLMGVKGATITPAISYAKGGTGTENQLAARVRINYAF
jgi:hypothetical protein